MHRALIHQHLYIVFWWKTPTQNNCHGTAINKLLWLNENDSNMCIFNEKQTEQQIHNKNEKLYLILEWYAIFILPQVWQVARCCF